MTEYISALMRSVQIETSLNGTWYGRIPAFSFLVASGPTPDACFHTLHAEVEGEVSRLLREGNRLPTVDGIEQPTAAMYEIEDIPFI